MKITLLANNNNGLPGRDGARSKLQNILRAFAELNIEVNLIDVASRKKNALSVVRNFIKALKNDDVVVIMLAVNGCRFFLKISSLIRRRAKLVLCPIGIGPIRKVFDRKLSNEQIQDFLTCRSFFGLKDRLIRKILSKTDSIVVENNSLKTLYESFYCLHNVNVLTNFRFINSNATHLKFNSDFLKIVFFSRVTKSKGILDLMHCVRELNEEGDVIYLDIYGNTSFDENEQALFDSIISSCEKIRYMGQAESSAAIDVLTKYDLHCLPTHHLEGTPGSLIEAILATTPTLCTSLPQISEFIEDGVDGFIVPLNNNDALKKSIDFIYKHLDILPIMSKKLESKRQYFSFDFQKDIFSRLFLNQ